MILNKLKDKMIQFYNITETNESPFDMTKNKEDILLNLLFIIDFLKENKYTLSHICLSDFVFIENVLILNKDTHLVHLDDKLYFRNVYDSSKDNNEDNENNEDYNIEFPTKELMNNTRVSISSTYESIGLFVYYLYFERVKLELTETDLQKIKGTKPYYFIKNTVYKFPYIIYL
jgi:hypothetical protein